MKRVLIVLALAGLLHSNGAAYGAELWRQLNNQKVLPPVSGGLTPTDQLAFALDEAAMRLLLFSAPGDPAHSSAILLPMGDGSLRTFRVWQTPMLPDALAARYPEIKTFTGEAVGAGRVTVKLDFTVYGFHAMVFDGDNTTLIDPADNNRSGVYRVHYRRNEVRGNRGSCAVDAYMASRAFLGDTNKLKRIGTGQSRVANGYQLRTYRLALSADHFYCQKATGESAPDIPTAFSKMVTTMNRVNGVYERELSVTMKFVEREDTLVWPTESGSKNGLDPFRYIDNNPPQCLNMNQIVCDTIIGSDNYDIGHVFTTNGGGLSDVGVVCNVLHKARSVTGQENPVGDGFDIDFVAHEIGHEFGSEHTFNNSIDNSCAGNAVQDYAYEPGSGSTIMCYAGICNPDDIQPHSDAYFSLSSLLQMNYYLTRLGGDGCAAKTPTGNKPSGLSAYQANYSIPFRTPFELAVPAATDSVVDTSATNYCWEQWNLGDFGIRLADTRYTGPLFRSFNPSVSPLRVFPQMAKVLSGRLNDAGTENAQGEKTPDTTRYLTFRLTVRDIYHGNGAYLAPDDTVHLDVVNTGTAFTVTSQSDSGSVYVGNYGQTVKWMVSGTNVAPINTDSVQIYLSADGGYTWSYYLGQYPNTGAAIVTLPNPDTTIAHARIKVKGAGNVFFNVNRYDFTVKPSTDADTAIHIFPVPAHHTLHMSSGNKGPLNFEVFNTAGQKITDGTLDGFDDLQVQLWARGVNLIRFTDRKNNRTVMKFVLD